MAALCHYCHAICEDYNDLAKHIRDSKKGHARGKKWAAAYLLKVRILNKKKDKPEHDKKTPEQKEAHDRNKPLTVREMSGSLLDVVTICPQCKAVDTQKIPVEYARSKDAWRARNGTLIISCHRCQLNDKRIHAQNTTSEIGMATRESWTRQAPGFSGWPRE